MARYNVVQNPWSEENGLFESPAFRSYTTLFESDLWNYYPVEHFMDLLRDGFKDPEFDSFDDFIQVVEKGKFTWDDFEYIDHQLLWGMKYGRLNRSLTEDESEKISAYRRLGYLAEVWQFYLLFNNDDRCPDVESIIDNGRISDLESMPLCNLIMCL